jgi:hypothetical protein
MVESALRDFAKGKGCKHTPFMASKVVGVSRRICFLTEVDMTKTLLPLLAGLLLLTGCAQTYVIRLTSGERITASNRPRLENGFYHFKDSSGREARPIFASRVREIAPASMTTDPNSAFKSVQSK